MDEAAEAAHARRIGEQHGDTTARTRRQRASDPVQARSSNEIDSDQMAARELERFSSFDNLHRFKRLLIEDVHVDVTPAVDM